MKSSCCIISGVFYGSPVCCHFFITPSFPGLPKLPGLPGNLPVTYLVTSLPLPLPGNPQLLLIPASPPHTVLLLHITTATSITKIFLKYSLLLRCLCWTLTCEISTSVLGQVI